MSDAPILTPFLDDADVILYAGDCVDVMRRMPEASVDAIVTDPPYELGFMGKAWDGTGIAYQVDTWAAALRVLKPGGHLLAFSGTRTYHRMTCAIEDTGFEIRDCIAWMYGSGFPKSLDVSKAIDKAAGAEREVLETIPDRWSGKGSVLDRSEQSPRETADITAPATSAAQKWNGWGTALKPAYEPVVVARKPLIGTVAQNVLEHGTGALNIDACRIGADGGTAKGNPPKGSSNGIYGDGLNGACDIVQLNAGRWPANVALDDAAASMLDEQSGDIATQRIDKPSQVQEGKGWSRTLENRGARGYTDNGGASRFFYTAKASRQDRNVGGLANNTHPTVKPTELMRWLIRLVTPPGGIILDPFGGSGSTGLAARAENVRCILIEREPEYLEIIRDRLSQLSLLSELLDDE